eukprot:179301_1
MMQNRETFSLEEVFREIDVDGNGSIDLDEFQHGLLQMMGDSALTPDDLELVFKSIADGAEEISWRQFYSFFDGKRLTRSSSRRHKMQISTQLTLLPDLHKLTTLKEDKSDAITAVTSASSLPAIAIDDEKKSSDSESKHVQKVKQTIRECLNLGEDSNLMNSPVSVSGGDSPIAVQHHRAQHSSANIPANTDDIDVALSLLRIEDADDLMELMEHNIFLCPDTMSMTRWENRYQYHKIRINNFRKILNGMLSSKIVSMRDENTTLREQLENIRDTNGGGGDQQQQHTSMQELADLHNQQLSSLKFHKSGKKGKKRSPSSRSVRSRSTTDFDDTSSLDSEVNLVYTKGAKLDTKESEGLINRVKAQKKEIKKLTREAKKGKEAHKLEVVKMKRLIDSQNTKIKGYEKARKAMVEQQSKIQAQMRTLRTHKSKIKSNIKNSKSESAASQREISVLKKQLTNLQNELEAEQDRKRNLQRKLARVISAGNKQSDKLNGANSTVSYNKLKRLEKEKGKLEQEVVAKSKKMDDMFLRLGSRERKMSKLVEENAELKAQLGTLTSQLREGNRHTNEFDAVVDERDRAFAEIESLEKRITKLNERISKLKSRNRKLKDRIKKLLETIAEIDRMAARAKQLIRELGSMQKELNAAETENLKYKNQNDTLNTKIAELRAMIRAKKDLLESSTSQLEKFANELSAEYSVIQTLQDQIEEKESALGALEQQKSRHMSNVELLESEKEDLSMELIRSQAKVESSQKIITRYKERLAAAQQQIEAQNEKLINYEQNEIVKLRSDIADLEHVVESKNAEIELLKQKNEQLISDLNVKRDISNDLKEKKDEIDDLMNKIEALQNKVSAHQDKYKKKCNEYDELDAKYKKLEKDLVQSQGKIGKLNIRIKEYGTAKMQEDDEVKLKLKRYNVQIVTIEENKKLIEKLRQQVGQYKTKWQLEQEAFDRYKKANAGLAEQVDEMEKLIKKKEKKIRTLQKELDMSGYGDKKKGSTLSLLRENVQTMESIIRTKEFEIKKLKNNLAALGGGVSTDKDAKEMKRLKKEIEINAIKMDKLEGENRKQKESLNADHELMNAKNAELTQLKLQISELKEYQDKVVAEQKENQMLNKQVSVMRNEKEEMSETLNESIEELKRQLTKVKTDKQRRIDALEAEIAEKDSALMVIGQQVGSELMND